MDLKRKRSFLVVVLAMLMVLPAAFANFPDKPITYIISFNPGGESDITARLQKPLLEKYLGVHVNIVYKPGGGGAVGWSALQRAKPDGYTIAGINLPHIVAEPMVRNNAGFKTTDFAFIYLFQVTPQILVVRQSSQFKTLDQFISYLKAHPGAVTVGGVGTYTGNYLANKEFESAAGVTDTYVPFTGTGTAVPALLGGHVDALMTNSDVGVNHADQVLVLGVAADQRLSQLPKAPTFKEQGIDLVDGIYRGVAAPKGTPASVVSVLEAAFAKSNAALKAKFEAQALEVVDLNQSETKALVEKDISTYSGLLK